MDIDKLNQWLDKEVETTTTIDLDTANLMQATLNRGFEFKNEDELPPAWHWLYFHRGIVSDNLGIEGHEKLGNFMPPVVFASPEAPRRMWAGGKFTFYEPIRIGDFAFKISKIKSITPKEGRSGNLVFVVVEHEVHTETLCLVEEQTIVYKEPVDSPVIPVAPEAPKEVTFSKQYQPDPIMLFRYSALTFNAHRIHYDLDFCREEEGYPNLVVHGPLTATLILDLYYQQFPNKKIKQFEYRGQSPLFVTNPFAVHGKADGQAWVTNHEGGLAMSATVSYE